MTAAEAKAIEDALNRAEAHLLTMEIRDTIAESIARNAEIAGIKLPNSFAFACANNLSQGLCMEYQISRRGTK